MEITGNGRDGDLLRTVFGCRCRISTPTLWCTMWTWTST